MRHAILHNSGGFTYLAAMFLVMIMGIMLGIAGQSWVHVMKREREQELIYRGSQIVQAIKRWRKPTNPPHPIIPLYDLEHLLKDPRSFANVKHLRKLYKDPITGKDWVLIKDPQRGITGVASSSQEVPLRQSNFQNLCSPSDEYLVKMFRTFEGKTKYSDWQFVFLE
jgi:type II secretory pathway pseudopilin PulG